MSSATFPIVSKDDLREPLINAAKPGQQYIGKVGHLDKDIMPPAGRRHDPESEDFTQREALHILTLSSTSLCKAMEAQLTQPKENGNGAANRRVTWLMGILSVVTMLSAGASFLTSSGIAIGGKSQELQQTQRDLQRLQADHDKLEVRNEKYVQQLREYEVWLQTTREKLADKGWKLPPLPKGQD